MDSRRVFTGILLVLPRIACMCAITVAFELDGYFRSCFVVKVRKVARYPALIACSSVVIVGEKRDIWYKLVLSAMVGESTVESIGLVL